jgi:hypothetical protein
MPPGGIEGPSAWRGADMTSRRGGFPLSGARLIVLLEPV